MRYLINSIIFVTICCQQINCLYFHIRETERKCFIEEVPDETLVVGLYILHLKKNNRK